ncbi:MAG: hypothetical protein KAH32_00515 [Chlamydiia bacterium]|nr:hypothetical protein [Chlamydiia bacterium]
MKKTKKALLTLGSLGAVAAPIAGVISCGMGGYEGRFDQADDGTIKIMYI